MSHPLKNKDIINKIWKNLKKKRYNILKSQLLLKNILLLTNEQDYVNNDTFNFKCLTCNTEFTSSNTNVQLITCDCRKNISNNERNILS